MTDFGKLPPIIVPKLQSPLTREFEFTDADFECVRKLIYAHAGITLSPIKRDMVYSRLARRLRATGKSNFSDYLSLVDRGVGPEWECFVNALTTNLTSFFREPHHFPILADYLKKNQGRPVKIWCCAASTGEEPYSIAMTAVEALGGFNTQVSIIASDLDTNVLAVAKAGVYAADRLVKVSKEQIDRFFLRVNHGGDDRYAACPELRRMITFERINLLAPNWQHRGPLDVIFCRNVMIYFDKPTQYKVLARFVPLLHPDGLLFSGHSESFLHAADLFRSLGKTVYAKAEQSR